MRQQALIGQRRLFNTLTGLVKKGQLPHSQLFIDSEGFGGLALALALSEVILNGDASPHGAPFLDHPDLHFLFPSLSFGKDKNPAWEKSWRDLCSTMPYASVYDWIASLEPGNKQGSIRVDAVLEMQRKAALKPYSGRNKVFIIWGAELILEQASNKLLKLLEEPPTHTYFMIIAEHTDQILPTLLSRCQTTKMAPIAYEDLWDSAREKYPEETRLEEMVRAACGSWRRLVNIVEHFDEIEALEKLWVAGLRMAFSARGNKKIVLSLFDWSQNIAHKPRESQKYFLLFGLELIRSALMIQYHADGVQRLHSFTGFRIDKFAAYVHSENILDLRQLIEESYYELSRNANAKILFTRLALELSRLLNRPVSAL